MCGIAGIFQPQGLDPKLLIGMTDLVSYRGPDGYGFAYFDINGEAAETYYNEPGLPRFRPTLGFGHRRLRIVDLSERGRQPMFDRSGFLCITYNGEVYNHR